MQSDPLQTLENPITSRRSFLRATTLIGGVVVGAAPMVSVASSPVTLRLQSTWPAKDIFHEYALDFAKKEIGRAHV